MALIDLFTSFEDGDPQPPAGDQLTELGAGPAHSPTARTGAGFTGLRALRYRTPGGVHRSTLFTPDAVVGEHTELSYLVFPESDPAPTWQSTFVAVDLEFTDGTTLSGLGGTDEHGFPLSAEGQGAARTLYLDQWNLVRCRVGAVAAGRTVRAVVLRTAAPGPGTGWLDDLRIAGRPPRETGDPVDWVRTTRGSHSSRDFSRGNTFPAVAVPHGFNFWTPVTDAGATDWLYEYHRRNNAANRPELQAFALSHQPSPWMGDRHTFQLMPGLGPVTADRRQRALAFGHDRETDRPHHYRVGFDNGITAELAPTTHGAAFRFELPEAGWLLFDNVANRGGLRIDRGGDTGGGTVTGHTWVRSRLSTGARRMFVHVEVDTRATGGGKLRSPGWRTVTGYLGFAAGEVTLRVATSLISQAQARRNLELELPAGTSFDQVRDTARREWNELLGRVEIEGATEDQRGTFYSCLYRLFLYPNIAHENTGTAARPHHRHASPVRRRWWPSTSRRTGAAVVDGPLTVNTGFWDSYRTAWPALALLAPRRCGELIEGFVQHYREGGWISRWSSPGYANLMTGTSSDVAFADAWLKGVRNFDIASAYDAAVKNATVTPTGRGVGRKGLGESIFLGYTPTSTGEGLSWALEGCVNDLGIANLSAALARDCAADDPRRREYLDNAAYFADRATRYVHHFDRRTGFFQGRRPGGAWRHEPAGYDPCSWGGDYTETNGWNTAFSVPQDGAGLAALHGGRAALKSTLDRFFATVETGRRTGAYGGVIHEMTEARDVRLGQYGHSNQPSHHIPYMYHHAGAPWRVQELVREVLARCHTGGDIGQGWAGDEDNGEMSAWYVFGALGLYPLAVGSPRYVLGSPLFSRATVHLDNGTDLVINAPGNTARTPYVRGLRVNGEAYQEISITHRALTEHGAVLDFDLATEPSDWGREQPPPSPSAGIPRPLADLPGTGRSASEAVPALFDDTTATQVGFGGRTAVIEYTVDGEPLPAELYTLTSGRRGGDPRSWVLEGSADGARWTVLDKRRDERFRWRRQTRPFGIALPGRYRHYRLRITGSTGGRLALTQWELLARPESES